MCLSSSVISCECTQHTLTGGLSGIVQCTVNDVMRGGNDTAPSNNDVMRGDDTAPSNNEEILKESFRGSPHSSQIIYLLMCLLLWLQRPERSCHFYHYNVYNIDRCILLLISNIDDKWLEHYVSFGNPWSFIHGGVILHNSCSPLIHHRQDLYCMT